MVNFDVEKYRADGKAVLETIPAIESVVDSIVERGYDNMVVIGIGGTWTEWNSVIAILRHYTDLPIYLENAAEILVKRDKRYLTPRSIVITASVSGDTKEVLAAAKMCREMGIDVVGFTKSRETPLGKLLTHWIPYTAAGCDNAYMLYFTLALYLLSTRGEYGDYGLWKAQLGGVHEELIRIREELDPRARAIARKYHKEPYNMWVGSGSMWGNVYLFTMCLLEEMQWVRTKAVTSADFFHGTLELVEEGVPVFLVKGVDEYRPLDQRVENFIRKYEVTDKLEVLDMADFQIRCLDDRFREIAAVLIFGATVVDRLSKQYEQFTGHWLQFRRYYRQLDY